MKQKVTDNNKGSVSTVCGLAVFISVLILGIFVIDICCIVGTSMNPNIFAKKYYIFNKAAYGLRRNYHHESFVSWGSSKRGDIVAFYSPDKHMEIPSIKRVVGLPGDRVAMKDNIIFINGEALEYKELEKKPDSMKDDKRKIRYLEEGFGKIKYTIMLTPEWMPKRHTFKEYKIPEGQYFVIGDNRNISVDSRTYGPIKESAILGRYVLAISSE